MTKKERYLNFVNYFSENAPQAETELNFKNGYELIVAVILSAQCTDVRINLTTPALFKKFPDFLSLSQASFEDVFALIKSISYPNNKAKHLIGMAMKVMEQFHGNIPNNTDDLQTLPGVGRKTANVVASVLFEQPKMAVDTHVFRVSARLGLTTGCTTPLQTELQLVKYLPEEVIHVAHHWLILHGRYTCIARKPKCEICPLSFFCKDFQKKNKV